MAVGKGRLLTEKVVAGREDALSFSTCPFPTAILPFLSSREVVTFFSFPQKGLLIDVANGPTTALALGNGPLLSATLSFLSSRAADSLRRVGRENDKA